MELLFAALTAAGATAWARERPTQWAGPRGDPEPLVGRAADLGKVQEFLRHERCVVLTGPGGVGKTRLALAAADQASAAFRDGVAILEVGDLPPEKSAADGGLVPLSYAVEAALGPAARSTGTGDLQKLLVIDNAEHVTDTLTELSRLLLADFPGLSLIVTSRRPMSAPFACSWEVAPLKVTGDDRPAAVELFLRRARSACPTLDLTGQLGPIRRLCEKLDGIPFAIELAAMRLRSISLARLLREETISQVIDQPRPTGLPHQRTLADSVKWSYDLLEEESRAVLHRLAALNGAFTIEDAESVCRREGAPIPDLVGRLSGLIDSSLVQVQRGPRYSYRLLGHVHEIVNTLGETEAAPERPERHVQQEDVTDGPRHLLVSTNRQYRLATSRKTCPSEMRSPADDRACR